MRAYLAEAKERGIAGRTLRDYERIVRAQIEPAPGKTRAHNVRRRDVVAFLGTISGDRSKQYAYGVLKAGLAVHVRHVNPHEDPFPPRSAPKARKRNYEPLATSERGALLAALDEHEHGTLLLLSIATGLRPSELLGLRWSDVGEDHVIVRFALDKKTREVGPTKTDGSRRRVDVPSAVVAALARHRERDQARHREYIAWKAAPPESKRRDRPNPAAAGVHPKVVQERLGHSSIRLTMDTYSHLMPGMQREAVSAVAAMLVTPSVTPNANEGT